MEKKGNAFGITSVVLGIIGFLTGFIAIGIIFDILAIIFGLIAIISNKQKSGLGIAGLTIAIISIIILMLLLAFGFKGSSKSETAISDSDLSTTEYSFHAGVSNTMYVLVIKNNSKETVDISGETIAFDSNGKKVGVAQDTGNAIAPSESACLQFYYDTDNAASFKHSLEYKISSYSSITSKLKFEETKNDNNIIVTCTNNSDKTATSIQANIIFFNGNVAVGCKKANFGDDNAELKAGENSSVELDCHQKFDDYKIFYTAR
jgi:hypothetical protein